MCILGFEPCMESFYTINVAKNTSKIEQLIVIKLLTVTFAEPDNDVINRDQQN